MDKRVTGLYPTKNFKLVLEFSNDEYKFVDIRDYLKGKKSPLKDITEDLTIFLTASVNEECGTVQWCNGVDLDSDVLYERSKPLDELNLV
jgi:hypothetical protein